MFGPRDVLPPPGAHWVYFLHVADAEDSEGRSFQVIKVGFTRNTLRRRFHDGFNTPFVFRWAGDFLCSRLPRSPRGLGPTILSLEPCHCALSELPTIRRSNEHGQCWRRACARENRIHRAWAPWHLAGEWFLLPPGGQQTSAPHQAASVERTANTHGKIEQQETER